MDEDYIYIGVWLGAVILTFLEVIFLGVNIIYYLLIALIIGMALIKAILIAGVFQHLFFERKALGLWYLLTVLTLIAIVVTWITGR